MKKIKVSEENKNIIVENIEDFDIGQTLECGQCFHFDKISDNDYVVIAKGKLIRVSQEKNKLNFINCTLDEYNNVWEKYFDIKRDYKEIKKILLEKDNLLKEAIDTKYGVHILNQDFFEMLISFIISQNKQIPHIRQIVFLLSKRYGKYLETIEEKEYYSFPSIEELKNVTEEEFKECKTGFRASYLLDACRKMESGEISEEKLESLSYDEALKLLMTIKGVGEKVGNCVLLFGLSRREAFPIDVWMKRILEHLYFHKDMKKEQLQEFAKAQYGEYGGYAQQYLFYYARDGKIKNDKMR